MEMVRGAELARPRTSEHIGLGIISHLASKMTKTCPLILIDGNNYVPHAPTLASTPSNVSQRNQLESAEEVKETGVTIS
jgi:hypothetical protein